MRVPEWESRRPTAPWLPVVRDRRYLDGLTIHRVGKPVFTAAECTMCALCWILCPDGAIARGPDGLTFDFEDCRGCGICAAECPRHAITMLEDAG